MKNLLKNENLILISDIKGKKSVYYGKIAEIMEYLFFVNNHWLTSVQLEKRIYTFEDLKVVFVELENSNDLV